MHLLRRTVWPVGGNVLRRDLDADPPLTGRVDDAVKRLVVVDVPVQHSSPERTFSVQVGGVEHDHASHEAHG